MVALSAALSITFSIVVALSDYAYAQSGTLAPAPLVKAAAPKACS